MNFMKILSKRDLRAREVATVLPDTDTETAWDLMSDHRLRHLVVEDRDGELLGVVSRRDILRHVLIERVELPSYIERARLARTAVRDVMV